MPKKRSKKAKRLDKQSSRSKDPVRYKLINIKNRAKELNVPFDISLEWFRQWCADNNYMELRGRGRYAASIDRKIRELGYVEGNIQILSTGANSSKGNYERWGTVDQNYMSAFDDGGFQPLDIEDF